MTGAPPAARRALPSRREPARAPAALPTRLGRWRYADAAHRCRPRAPSNATIPGAPASGLCAPPEFAAAGIPHRRHEPLRVLLGVVAMMRPRHLERKVVQQRLT